MEPRTANILWALAVVAIITLALLLSGCAHPAPAHIALPTTAAVRAPLVSAKASNAKAVRIATRAVKSGLAAGSQDAKDLAAFTLATDGHVTAALAQVDTLTAQLLDAQHRSDTLAKHDAVETARVEQLGTVVTALRSARRHWIEICLALLVADFFAGGLIQRCLQAVFTFSVNLIARGYRLAAVALKTAFPLYFFWLP